MYVLYLSNMIDNNIIHNINSIIMIVTVSDGIIYSLEATFIVIDK